MTTVKELEERIKVLEFKVRAFEEKEVLNITKKEFNDMFKRIKPQMITIPEKKLSLEEEKEIAYWKEKIKVF